MLRISPGVKQFFLPAFNKRYLFRILLLALNCYLIFTYLLIPLRIQGQSMEPTYTDNSFAFCWSLQYLLSPPERLDVVTIRYSGRKVMLLKRIIALPGETVAFKNGLLFVNGKLQAEPYVHYHSNWDLPTRTVKPGHVYVVGDNRGTEMSLHHFGQVKIERIVGGVLF